LLPSEPDASNNRKHNLLAPKDCAFSLSASEICQKT